MALRQLAPDLQVVLAPNPGPMTGPGTNQYLLGKEALALVDVADLSDENRLRLDAAPGRVTRIVLTHGHPDHLGGALDARAACSAPVAIHRHHAGRTVGGRPLVPEHLLADGDEIDFGTGRLVVLHTPGHDPGHCCFFEPRRRWLFTGDTVLSTGTSMIGPPDGDMTAYLATLARLAEIDAAVIFPGHGPPIADPRRVLTEYVAHRRMREAQIFEAVRGGGQTVDAIVERVYAGLPAVLRWAAALQVEAHLEKLVAEARVVIVGGRVRAV